MDTRIGQNWSGLLGFPGICQDLSGFSWNLTKFVRIFNDLSQFVLDYSGFVKMVGFIQDF